MNNITYAVSVDVNNPTIPYNVYVASVLDSNVRCLEITLYENGNVITLSNTATATASLVTDNVLVDDSVECTISSNIITVPLEDLQRHGNLDVQVTVTEGTKVLAIPFPIQVRVTPNIAENAQIDENSLGSYAEVVHEIAEARGTHTTLHDAIAAKLDDADDSVKENNIADESITVEKVADDLAAVINAKEEKSNKKTTLTGNESSNDFYPTTKAVADALSGKAPAATAFTFDDTTTTVTFNENNPKIIYLNATVGSPDNEKGIVLTSADNTVQYFFGVSKSVRVRNKNGASTYTPWELALEKVGNKKNIINSTNLSSTEFYPSIKSVVDYLTANYIGNGNNTVSWDNLAVAVQNLINGKENTSNKLTSADGIDENSTDTEYPTAKAVFDFGGHIVDVVGEDIAEEVGDLKSAFSTFEIECYDRVESSGQERQNIDLSFTAGSYPKATHNTVTIETGISDIKYAVTSVVPGETIHVHCQNNWMARAYLFADSSGKGLSWFPENSISPTLYDTDVVVPENAATMYIMGKLNTDVYAYRVIPVPAVITFNLDVDELMEKIEASAREELVVSISNDTLSVSNGVKTVVAGLHASNNGGFSFGSIYGKNASDDVCPVKINGSYVGGNHGFTAKIIVNNSNGHGKTIADIGSVYERSDIPGREYVIVSVPSTTTLWLIRRDGSMELINSGLSFTFTHVSGGTNTDPISFTSLSSYQQLQPGINNIDLAIFADATMITSGETKCNRLKIVETYNIMSLAEIADYLIDNVGQNDNTSYYDDAIAGIAKRTTVYEIIGDMSITVSDYLQSLGAYTLNAMGIVQSQMLGTKFLAPYTTYSGIQTITSNVTIDKQVWSNVDVPLHKIYQLDTTNDIKGQLMLYPPFGLGVTAQRVDALGANGTACTIDGSTKKFYPIFYGKNIEITAGTLIGGYAIRTPFEFDENGIFSFVYKIAGKTYAEIECIESGDYYASVGSKYTIIRNMMAKQNIVLNTETIIDGIVYFHCTGNGSITLEIA